MTEQQDRFLVIAAPSGAGKGTLINHLLEAFPWLSLSVSATTRGPRPGEQDGIQYHFLSPEAFQQNIDQDAFIEWEEFYGGKRYGTLKSEVERILAAGQVPVFEVEVKGALNLKKMYGDRAELVFITTPSLEVIEKRLRDRGTESDEVIATRMERAAYEITLVDQFDHIVMNDNLEVAKQDILNLVRELFPEHAKNSSSS